MGRLPWIPERWNHEAPILLVRACERWALTPGPRLGGLASHVFECTDERSRALVLKLAPAEALPELEAAALRQWDGEGAPRLIDFDADLGALLMERIRPGTPMPPGDDDNAVEGAALTLALLHARTPIDPHAFPTQLAFFDVWLERVHASMENDAAGVRLLDSARAAAVALENTARSSVLLHGDFIDKNLLLGRAGYAAVDPIPRVGDPCSDVGFFSAYHPPARRIASRARELAAALGLDPERAARWAAVWAVGEATETWRADSDELQAWVVSAEAADLLRVIPARR